MSERAKKWDPEFQELLRKNAKLDEATGNLRFDNLYASCYINFGWKGSIISVPHSHVVWFLSRGRWPEEGKFIDHVNDESMDNRPENLQELTEAENQAKRRGRKVYRSYGTSKYGHGIYVLRDKRDGRYYINRQLSRGHGDGDLKNVRKSLGGFDTLEQAEIQIAKYVAEIEATGPSHMPTAPAGGEKQKTIALRALEAEIRRLRAEGKTFDQIAKITGYSQTSIYHRAKDLDVDARPRGESNPASVLTEEQVARFKALRREGLNVAQAASNTGIGRSMAYQIDSGHRWKHVP